MAAKTPDQRRLGGQQQREVARRGAALGQLLLPGEQHHDRAPGTRQRDHDQRDAVDAERELGAERRDPVDARTRAGSGCRPRRPAPSRRTTSRPRARSAAARMPIATCLAAAGVAPQRVQHQGADQREHQQDGEQEVHANTTASRAPMTRTEPPSMDSAYERTKPVCSRRSRPGAAAEQRRRAVDQPVDAAVVEVDQRAGEPGAGPGDERLVDRVARRGRGGRPAPAARPARAARPDAVAPDRQPGDQHAERGEPDDQERHHGVRDRARRRGSLAARRATGRASPAGRPPSSRKPATDRAERQHDHRDGHRRGRLVRVVVVTAVVRTSAASSASRRRTS